MEKSYKIKLDKTLADIYGIDTEKYGNFLVSSVPLFSKRTLNCLNKKGIETVKMLLELSPNELFEIDAFGNKCFTEIKKFCQNIIFQNYYDKKKTLYNYEKYLNNLDIHKITKNEKKTSTIFLSHALDMARGDFSFTEKIDINSKRKKEMDIYKKAYQILGEDLATFCVQKDPYILDFFKNLKSYENVINYHFKISELLKKLPAYRINNNAIHYINAYTLDDELRDALKNICKKQNFTIKEMANNLCFDDDFLHLELFHFLEWCNFDLNLEINKLFSFLYKDEREKEIIERCAKNQTLQEIGKAMGVTRQRVKQIEIKIKKKFADIHKEIRIISKICAERNGDIVLTPFEIEPYCGENFEVLIFLLREYKGINYTYDKQLDVFVVGNESVKEYAEKYVEELPDIIHEEQLVKIKQEAIENFYGKFSIKNFKHAMKYRTIFTNSKSMMIESIIRTVEENFSNEIYSKEFISKKLDDIIYTKVISKEGIKENTKMEIEEAKETLCEQLFISRKILEKKNKKMTLSKGNSENNITGKITLSKGDLNHLGLTEDNREYDLNWLSNGNILISKAK